MNLKSSFLVIITLIASINLNAQTPSFSWANKTGSSLSEIANGVCTDLSGNVYYTGSFDGSVDFDPGPGVFTMVSTGASDDIYVSKVNSSGNFVWAVKISGNMADRGNRIISDANGNVYITGYFQGVCDFNPGSATYNLTSAGSTDIFILKLNSSGSWMWAKKRGGTGGDAGIDLALDTNGHLYLAGTTSSTSMNTYIEKIDASSGNTIWSKTLGSITDDAAQGIEVDTNGNVYSTGYFTGSVNFGGSFILNAIGNKDIFVNKFDSTGTILWAKQIGSSGDDNGKAIKLDQLGGILVSGEFQNTADFDTGSGTFNLTSAGGQDGFITKLDSSGNMIWAEKIGGINSEAINAMSIDLNGNIYNIGSFVGTVDFDPGAGTFDITSSGNNAFISILDNSGSFVWAGHFYGGSNGKDIKVDSALNFYAAGYFYAPTDFDAGAGTFTLTQSGSFDIFTTKYAGCSSSPSSPASISGSTTICEGTTNNYFVTPVSGASSYTWTLPGGWTGTSTTNSINATADGTSGNITVTANNTCGSSSVQTIAITVNPLPITPGSISGATSICLASNNTYTVANDPNATSYTWTLPGGWSGTSNTNSISTIASTTSGNITVTANNTCGSSSGQTLAISVSTIPATPVSISGLSTICSGTNNTYSVTNDPTATSYTWNIPSGWTGTSTTNSISTTAGTNSGLVTVTANNFCGSSSVVPLSITVNTIPSFPGSISGNATICEGTSNTYSVNAVSGATSYIWTLPSGWSGTSSTNSISTTSNTNSGNITVTANNGCGNSSASTLSITVNALPNVGLVLPADLLCEYNSPLVLSGGTPSGGIYTGTGVSSGNFDPAMTGTGIFQINYTFTDANSCTNTASDNMTVDACLGMNENENNAFSIYPNPTNGIVNIISTLPAGTLKIYNAIGEFIYTSQLSSQITMININEFDNGIYFIQLINTDNLIATKRIIKE